MEGRKVRGFRSPSRRCRGRRLSRPPRAPLASWRWRALSKGPGDTPEVDSKQKPPSISAVRCPWCHVGLRWAYGETEVRKITGRGAPIFSAFWFRSTAPGFRNWHLPVHMGLLAHPRPCHRLAVPAAPHGPCTQQWALFSISPDIRRTVYICKIDGKGHSSVAKGVLRF